MFVSLQFLIIIIEFKNYYFYLFIHLSSNSFVLIINELTALIEFEDTKIEQLLLILIIYLNHLNETDSVVSS